MDLHFAPKTVRLIIRWNTSQQRYLHLIPHAVGASAQIHAFANNVQIRLYNSRILGLSRVPLYQNHSPDHLLQLPIDATTLIHFPDTDITYYTLSIEFQIWTWLMKIQVPHIAVVRQSSIFKYIGCRWRSDVFPTLNWLEVHTTQTWPKHTQSLLKLIICFTALGPTKVRHANSCSNCPLSFLNFAQLDTPKDLPNMCLDGTH